MDENTSLNKRNHRRKLLAAVIALCSGISILGDFAAWIIRRMGGISFSVRNAATIGIIGGADGPTAVFITASGSPGWQILVKILLLIAAFLLWRSYSKRK